MKYRTIPITIEAFQLKSNAPVPDWFLDAFEHQLVFDFFFTPNLSDTLTVMQDHHLLSDNPTYIGCHIRTPEGVMTASPGDYIIRGVYGAIYPCKPDTFIKNYEPIEEDNH